MKQILIKLSCLVLLASAAMVPLIPSPVAAASCSGGGTQLTLLPPWYKDLDCNSSGTVQIPSSRDELQGFILQIIMNGIEIMLYIVGYVSLAMIIWGGFKYMLMGDNPSNVEGAKKTIQNAIIGLIISIFAIVIVNLVAGVF